MARRPHPAVAFTGGAVLAALLGTMVPRPEIRPAAPPSWRERYRRTQPLPTTQVVQYWNYEPRGTPEASRPPGHDPEAERRRIIAEVEADNRAYARLMAEVGEAQTAPSEKAIILDEMDGASLVWNVEN